MKALREWGGVILGLAALLAGGSASFVVLTAESRDALIKERVAKVEQQQHADAGRMDRIEKAIDKVDGKVDKLDGKIDLVLQRVTR